MALSLSINLGASIGRPDKGASVVSLATTAAAAIFANADDHLSNWGEILSQYNYYKLV